jgi:Fic family protein
LFPLCVEVCSSRAPARSRTEPARELVCSAAKIPGRLLLDASSGIKSKEANKRNEIIAWLAWFAGITIEAQRRTIALIEFFIERTRLFDRLSGQLNDRQEKALLRMFKEGPEGFKGGLSAGKYGTITRASPATTTRDLADLTEKGNVGTHAAS